MKKTFLLIGFLILGWSYTVAQEVSIIPKPQKIKTTADKFNINKHTTIQLAGVSKSDVAHFLQNIRQSTGYKLPLKNKANTNTIVFKIDPELKIPKESGYTLNITNKKVLVQAKTKKGIFYASQSLRQLLPASIESTEIVENQEWTLPGLHIKDYPRYAWRGYMQDVSRTFYDTEVIKKYLDVMALYKMNVFHWHLTDDQGWRIEIKKYPKLTSPLTTVFDESENQPSKRSGYFTQEEIKEIVEYAQKRNITIVPEIDVPGHTWPVLLIHPNLGVNDNTSPHYIFPFVSSWKYWGNQFTPNTLDPTKEEVYTFLKSVFTEVSELFPGDYIHFGGDEIQFKLWEKEPHVQQFMKEEGLANVEQLQSYFVQRISAIIEDLGKKPIGWNDILADYKTLPKETAIMSWLGEAAMKEATNHGFKAVATPSSHLYLDITQADRNDGTSSDLAYPNINSIDRIYAYNPSHGLSKKEKKLVMGVQANMWTALAQEVKEMNVQVFPRLLAVAEIGWTLPEHKNFKDFKNRLNSEEQRLTALKVPYYHSGGFIAGKWNSKKIDKQYSTLRYDVTDKIYANGRAVAGFLFTSGENFLVIDEVKLYKDGKLISEDLHHALADDFRGTNKIKPFYYNLKVKDYDPDAQYTLKAKVKGDGGTDSEGNFTFNLNPDHPFTAVEE